LERVLRGQGKNSPEAVPRAVLAALTVSLPGPGGEGEQVMPIIILGPSYSDPTQLNSAGRNLLQRAGGLENFQAIILLHELFHVKTGAGHREMAHQMGITYDPDTESAASDAIDNFFIGGCQEK